MVGVRNSNKLVKLVNTIDRSLLHALAFKHQASSAWKLVILLLMLVTLPGLRSFAATVRGHRRKADRYYNTRNVGSVGCCGSVGSVGKADSVGKVTEAQVLRDHGPRSPGDADW